MSVAVVSFFTPSWKYPEHAARLKAECKALGLPYRIEERPDTGTYLGNTRHKPAFVLEMLHELKSPVLWIDVDGSILRPPDALRDDVDFMGRRMKRTRNRTWHVGTLYFAYTPAALELVEAWVEATGRGSDEAAFDVAWKTLGWSGRWAELPATYFDVLAGARTVPGEGTVICHRLSKSPSKLALKARRSV